VPDYSRGINVMDLASRKVKLLGHPDTLSLAGIDGLYLRGRSVIAIQNGTAPPRVVRLMLDPELTRIESGSVIEANWAGLGQPTHGVMVGPEFYFIVNSGWDKGTGPPAIRRFRIQ
jgi:hypothetical protein